MSSQNAGIPELANVDAEQQLLGSLLVDNHIFLHVSNLLAKHFYEPVHQRIFTSMFRAWEKGQSFSPVTLKPEFDQDPALIDIGGSIYLVKLVVAAVSPANIPELAKMIMELSQRRQLIDVCDRASILLTDINESAPTEMAMTITDQLQQAVNGFDVSAFQDDYEITENILRDMKRDVQPYCTGYPDLDKAMGGGLYPGKSYGFAARKKMGKTILAGSIGCNLNIKGIRHLFICGEMSPAEIQKRTLARLLRVKQALFNSKEGRTDAFMGRIADFARKSSRSMIYRNAPGLTFEELKHYVLLARMQKRITGFILDYWQLVGGKPKGKSTAEHLDEVAQWIADTCRKYDLWSITMAQINQEGNTRGGEGIKLAFDQVYTLHAPNEDPGRSERWLEMSDTRYTEWRSVGSGNKPGFYLNPHGPYFSETPDDGFDL